MEGVPSTATSTGGWAKRMCIGGEIRTPSDEEASTPPPPDVDDLMRADNCDDEEDEDALPAGWKQLRAGGYANLSGDWDEFPGVCGGQDDLDPPTPDVGIEAEDDVFLASHAPTLHERARHHSDLHHHSSLQRLHHARHHSVPMSPSTLLIATPILAPAPAASPLLTADELVYSGAAVAEDCLSVALQPPQLLEVYEAENIPASPSFYSRENLVLGDLDEGPEMMGMMGEEEEEEEEERQKETTDTRSRRKPGEKCQTEV